MSWTDEEWAKLKRASGGRASDEAVLDVARGAVELAAARVLDDADLEALIREHVGPTDGRDAEAVRRAFHAHGATVATLQTKVAELEGERGKDAERIREIERAKELADHLYNEEHLKAESLRAEVERLKAEKIGWATEMERRAMTAEARLAVIRDTIQAMGYEPRWSGDVARSTLSELSHRLEGDAPQEGKTEVGVLAQGGTLHKCSPACTHDDAAKPGHPERVKERSEAFTKDAVLNFNGCQNDRERICYAAGREKGLDEGAEAMRTAVEDWARGYFGSVPPTLKAAIEGAAP
jgi:hypothetical protein